MAKWLWDYDAFKMTDADKETHAAARRTAKTGFSGALYKTDAFLRANPFGDIPAAFLKTAQWAYLNQTASCGWRH